MKPFSLILAILLPFLGITVQAQTGMRVVGDWNVSETASVGFWGKELTLPGDEKEERLIMPGKGSHIIDVHDKTIYCLVIFKPKVVKVCGKSIVRNSMAIEQDNPEAVPSAALQVDTTVTIFIAAGCQLILTGIILQSERNNATEIKQMIYSNDVGFAALTVANEFCLKPAMRRRLLVHGTYQIPPLQIITTPPLWA